MKTEINEPVASRQFHSAILDLKITINEQDTGIHLYEKFIQSIKKQKKKAFYENTEEEKLEFIQNSSTGMQKISIKPIRISDGHFEEYMISVLKESAGLTTYSLEDIQYQFYPVEVHLQKKNQMEIGYSLLNKEVKEKYHKKKWKVAEASYKTQTIYDLFSLIAETIALNNVEYFVEKNHSLMKYLTITTVNKLFGEEKTPIPTDKHFALDLEKEMRKLDLFKSETYENESINKFKHYFYGIKDENGFFVGLEHYLLLDMVMPEIIQELSNIQIKKERQKKENVVYAKTFETKKHILKRTMEKMENNQFLTHYGYVELDNEVDLGMFSSMEKEFQKLTQKVFIPSAKDHSFRMKRLGKQRANGQYYPTHKAIILDVEHPEVYVHELGHQIDCTFKEDYMKSFGMLSETIEFRPILDLYKYLTINRVHSLPNEQEERKNWEGKGKYNSQYYFQPTEIFARSFELYLFHKKIETPFLQKEYKTIEYPNEKVFLDKIETYFDALGEKVS